MSKLPFSSRLLLECAGIFFKLARVISAIVPLSNDGEPFGSLLWVQDNAEIVGSILSRQQTKEFSLVCGCKYT